MKTLKLKKELSELYTLNKFIHEELGKENLQLDLIIEEIFVNIVNYSKTEFIIVKVEYNPESRVVIEFVDNGVEFNPLLKDDPEMVDNIKDAEIGGRGIYLVKNLADDIEYYRENDKNHFKVIKNV